MLKQRAHGCERTAVMHAWAVALQGSQVRARAVAGMPVKAIFRILRVQFEQHSVARNLGENRGRGNGGDMRGAAYNGLGADIKWWTPGAVNLRQRGPNRKRFNRAAHCKQSCVQNVQTVYFFNRCTGNAVRAGARADQLKKRGAFLSA